MHDDQIPQVHFEIESWNDGSHVSADESHLKMMHTLTLLFSGILAFLMGMAIAVQLYEENAVHAAMFWVTAAAACDALSSMFELIHLSIYAHNGVGFWARRGKRGLGWVQREDFDSQKLGVVRGLEPAIANWRYLDCHVHLGWRLRPWLGWQRH